MMKSNENNMPRRPIQSMSRDTPGQQAYQAAIIAMKYVNPM